MLACPPLLAKDVSAKRTQGASMRNRQAQAGWKVRRQPPVGPFITDFACLEAGLVTEIDGATRAGDHEIEHDRKRSAFLTEQGFQTLRVSNFDVYDNLDGVVRMIRAALAPLGPSGHSLRARGETDSAKTLASPACGEESATPTEGAFTTSSTQGEF